MDDGMNISRRMAVAGLTVAALSACSKKPFQKDEAPVAEEIVQSQPLTDAEKSNLVELYSGKNGLKLDIRYATADNFTGRILYNAPRAFLVGAVAQDLGKAIAFAEQDGFGLTIFDAYRPLSVTKQLWDSTPKAQRNFVANPAKGSRHNRGCSLDIGLHYLGNGQAVIMPSAYDEFSPRAHQDYSGGSSEERQNRDRLRQYMEAAGFMGISNEWWHFDHRDWKKYPLLDVPFSAL
jgi:zinc D-Ala-D-Ala dipeptidase